ncbi:hypothetical protein NSQ89_18255 [Niallia sp. FSL R7-0648]|uniref:hypothetical protein n=1 Tax=Niallia sp. FSL R7-0648 TaxID=2954521 RepID=UPI0030F597B7
MLMELKDAFLFLMDIFKGKLPLHDLYLLVFIIVVTSIAETIQEKRKQSSRSKNTIFIYLKWIPISFLASSIYLTSFYFITNLFTKFLFTAEVFHQEQNVRSIAIMSLAMTSIVSLIIAIWKLYSFFIVKKALLTLISNSLLIAMGVYFINMFWYEAIIMPIWCYGIIGLINTIFISFLLLKERENLQSNSSPINGVD